MVFSPLKKFLIVVGLAALLAVELCAQGGLGAPPGRMGGDRGGGRRSGSSAAMPSGRIPSSVAPADAAPGAQDPSPPADTSGPAGPSRPVGNILFPGTPDRSNHGSILSPGLPGIVGQPRIIPPGLSDNRPPGSILTPGTPPVSSAADTPAPARIYATPGSDSGRNPNFGRNKHFRLQGNNGVIYPFLYYPFIYGYADGGYGDAGSTVSRTSSHSSYVIDGQQPQQPPREPHANIYEVPPDGPDEVESEPADGGAPQAEGGPNEPRGEVFYLIALKGGLIYAAREHWLLGNTLHFTTLQGEHYVISLQELDLDLSAQLNRERGLKFVLEVRDPQNPRSGEGAPDHNR